MGGAVSCAIVSAIFARRASRRRNCPRDASSPSPKYHTSCAAPPARSASASSRSSRAPGEQAPPWKPASARSSTACRPRALGPHRRLLDARRQAAVDGQRRLAPRRHARVVHGIVVVPPPVSAPGDLPLAERRIRRRGAPEREIPAFVKEYGLSTDGEERCTIKEKAKTNGAGAHPVWKLIQTVHPGKIEWNFAAVRLRRRGQAGGRPGMRELSAQVVESAIRALNWSAKRGARRK